MFDHKDRQTLYSLRELKRLVAENTKPVVLWIGAGASRWCNYPTWRELADRIHEEYAKHEKSYDLIDAGKHLAAEDYPALFSYCKKSNSQRYHRVLADTFAPREATPVYARFVRLLSELKPLYILTTNIDEALERHLHEAVVLQKPAVERIIDLIDRDGSFVCKLHGTVSDIESCVLTQEEYVELTSDDTYTNVIRYVFTRASVLFVGYSLSDEYVVGLLTRAESNRPIFGTGPHFAVLPDADVVLPDNTLPIKYSIAQHKDHRAAIQVVNVVSSAKKLFAGREPRRGAAIGVGESTIRSVYYISDFFPPGTWNTSTTAVLGAPTEDRHAEVTVGQGFVDSEMPTNVSSALHDLAVGLICFDEVYMPLSALSMLHQFIGEQRFWVLHRAGAIRFVQLPRMIAMGYEDSSSVSDGKIITVGILNRDGSPLTVEDEIKRHIIPLGGREKEAQPLLDDLAKKIVRISADAVHTAAQLTMGSLMHPVVRECLGISGAVLPNSLPRWNAFPVLRLAHIMQVGVVCQHFSMGAAKVGFGGEVLAGKVFSIAAAGDWAEEAASYVLSGHFNADLGTFIANEPAVFDGLLRFRDTEESVALRKEILQHLGGDVGADFVASVNAGLRRSIPGRILQRAHDKLLGLLLVQQNRHAATPAIWNNLRNSDQTLELWRERSLSILREFCWKRSIGPHDLCPCNSGEQLRNCCEEALRSRS